MGIYPPEFQFTINITLEQREFLTQNGSGSWRTLSTLQIGPHQRIAVSDTHVVCSYSMQPVLCNNDEILYLGEGSICG